MWFNRYNSLNFKVHFFKWTCCRVLNIHQVLHNNESNFPPVFRQHLKRFSNLPSWYLNWVFKVFASCSNTESKSLLKWQDSLITYQWTPVASHSISIPRQSAHSAMLVGFWHPCIARRTWQFNELRSGDLNISEVIFKSESQFNYFNFWTQPNIATKFARMWPESCSVSIVNLAKKFATIPEILNFS